MWLGTTSVSREQLSSLVSVRMFPRWVGVVIPLLQQTRIVQKWLTDLQKCQFSVQSIFYTALFYLLPLLGASLYALKWVTVPLKQTKHLRDKDFQGKDVATTTTKD